LKKSQTPPAQPDMKLSSILTYLTLAVCVFTISCKKESKVDPINPHPELSVALNKSNLHAYELFKITIHGTAFSANSYPISAGGQTVMLFKANDTLLVGGMAELPVGKSSLTGTIEGRPINADFEILPEKKIDSPKNYLVDFIASVDIDDLKVQLDSLVKKGVMSRKTADIEYKALADSQKEQIELVSSATEADRRVASRVIAANRAELDQVISATKSLVKMRISGQASTAVLPETVSQQLSNVTFAIAKIGVMIVAPALVAGSIAVVIPGQAGVITYWASAGAVLGSYLFRNAINTQKKIIVNNVIGIYDDAIIPIANSTKAEFRQRQAAEVFYSNTPYIVDVKIQARNIQAVDVNSEISVVKQFTIAYVYFKGLVERYMPEIGLLPDFRSPVQKEIRLKKDQIGLKITSNANVSSKLTSEAESLKVSFSSNVSGDQTFSFAYLCDVGTDQVIVNELQATLLVPKYRLEIIDGNNQQVDYGVELRNPLRVKVVSSSGEPAANVSVKWDVSSGGGYVSAKSSASSSEGIAETKWTIGRTITDDQLLSASIQSDAAIPKVTFKASGYDSLSFYKKAVLGHWKVTYFGNDDQPGFVSNYNLQNNGYAKDISAPGPEEYFYKYTVSGNSKSGFYLYLVIFEDDWKVQGSLKYPNFKFRTNRPIGRNSHYPYSIAEKQ
jgi:hypothetical protein